MIAARSLIALFSLPAVAGFARTPDWDGMSIEVAAEGYMPPNDVILGLPEDKCTKLEDPDAAPKILTDEWCGSRKTEDACVAGEVLKQGDKTILTTNGYVVMYDLCAWDKAFHDKQGNSKPKCRLAGWSYSCSVSCPGVPQELPRSISDNMVLDANCSPKMLASLLEFEKGDTQVWLNGGYTFYTPKYKLQTTCAATLISGGRRLEEKASAATPPAPRRRLDNGECPVGATENEMKNGNLCCDTSTMANFGVVIAGPFQKDVWGADETSLYESCTYKSIDVDTDECECTVTEDSIAKDPCTRGAPVRWGTQG